ncbi:FliM/FliN family flagellar motor switch protein [Ectopseudomonas mendocina]|uniref:FliM/FliN family flagellar motor switch protein n=1 Tax=Ectopseudomonas mendocina TaxID=300 RepID=A0ABZ2RFD7_ECTME
MTGIKKVHHGVPAESLTRLKPQKLGRHYHKIPQYIRELSGKYPRIISDYFLRNFRVNLELLKVDIHEQRVDEAECVYRSPLGKVGFSIERSLLTEALECYYGGICLPGTEAPPVSTSEQRLRSRLGVDICQLFARSVLSGNTFGKLETHDNAYDQAQWEYIAEYQFSSHQSGGKASIFVYLDSHLVDELTSRLSPTVPTPQSSSSLNPVRDLPVRLDCVLANLQMPLSQVLSLRPGDILPIRMLERCEVHINQQKLFRGNILEDDGSLLLTSLESVKTQ